MYLSDHQMTKKKNAVRLRSVVILAFGPAATVTSHTVF